MSVLYQTISSLQAIHEENQSLDTSSQYTNTASGLTAQQRRSIPKCCIMMYFSFALWKISGLKILEVGIRKHQLFLYFVESRGLNLLRCYQRQ